MSSNWNIMRVSFKKFFPITNNSSPPFAGHSIRDCLQISGTPGGWATRSHTQYARFITKFSLAYIYKIFSYFTWWFLKVRWKEAGQCFFTYCRESGPKQLVEFLPLHHYSRWWFCKSSDTLSIFCDFEKHDEKEISAQHQHCALLESQHSHSYMVKKKMVSDYTKCASSTCIKVCTNSENSELPDNHFF